MNRRSRAVEPSGGGAREHASGPAGLPKSGRPTDFGADVPG
ncbi:hypothetical protein [Streptomyces afghaniensis]